MDPWNVKTSVLAVVRAVERLNCLSSNVRMILTASEEIDAVLQELHSLSVVLQNMSNAVLVGGLDRTNEFLQPLESCKMIVMNIETELVGVFEGSRLTCKTALQSHVFRVRWSQKRKRIGLLTQRLEKAKATLALQLMVLNLCVCPFPSRWT